jgi:hypothetical protein
MNKMETRATYNAPSEFADLAGIEYFRFEEDFVEANMRCIPMIVRFKMDLAGIKLKLAEWVKFKKGERITLALLACDTEQETNEYNAYLRMLIFQYTGAPATPLIINQNPAWAETRVIPTEVKDHIKKHSASISTIQWALLSNLQRFALLKLVREGHENKNFPKAIREFGITTDSAKAYATI